MVNKQGGGKREKPVEELIRDFFDFWSANYKNDMGTHLAAISTLLESLNNFVFLDNCLKQNTSPTILDPAVGEGTVLVDFLSQLRGYEVRDISLIINDLSKKMTTQAEANIQSAIYSRKIPSVARLLTYNINTLPDVFENPALHREYETEYKKLNKGGYAEFLMHRFRTNPRMLATDSVYDKVIDSVLEKFQVKPGSVDIIFGSQFLDFVVGWARKEKMIELFYKSLRKDGMLMLIGEDPPLFGYPYLYPTNPGKEYEKKRLLESCGKIFQGMGALDLYFTLRQMEKSRGIHGELLVSIAPIDFLHNMYLFVLTKKDTADTKVSIKKPFLVTHGSAYRSSYNAIIDL